MSATTTSDETSRSLLFARSSKSSNNTSSNPFSNSPPPNRRKPNSNNNNPFEEANSNNNPFEQEHSPSPSPPPPSTSIIPLKGKDKDKAGNPFSDGEEGDTNPFSNDVNSKHNNNNNHINNTNDTNPFESSKENTANNTNKGLNKSDNKRVNKSESDNNNPFDSSPPTSHKRSSSAVDKTTTPRNTLSTSTSSSLSPSLTPRSSLSSLSTSISSTATTPRGTSSSSASPTTTTPRNLSQSTPIVTPTKTPSSSSSSSSSTTTTTPTAKWSQPKKYYPSPATLDTNGGDSNDAATANNSTPNNANYSRKSITEKERDMEQEKTGRERLSRDRERDREKDREKDRDKDREKERERRTPRNLVEDYGDEEAVRQKLLALKDKRKKQSSSSNSQVDQILSASFENLNITSEDVSMDELGLFLKESQEDNLIKEALMEGVDLKEYSKKIGLELRGVQNEIVPLCNEISGLYHNIGNCVTMLAQFENLLNSFQADLGNISDDIKNMQDQSMEKNHKINNRKAVIEKLHRFIEDLSLPQEVVTQLETNTISESYVQLLQSFNRKIGFIEMQKAQHVPAVSDMVRKYDNVRERVVQRVQKFITSHTASVKSFATLRTTQETLCSLSFLFQFLFIHSPDCARDVKDMDSCDKFYTSYYKSYLSALSKCDMEVATKNDLLGFFSSKLAKVNTKSSVFALGTRAKILNLVGNQPPMDPPKDQSTANKLSYEELFNSQLALLVNQANCEFMFVRDFFLADDDVTLGIFARCSDLLLENLDEHISPSFDAIGMLIILCLIDRYTELVPPNLEYLLHSLQKATTSVFTRFVIVFELNMASIRNANIQDLGPIDIRTHYITRRYGEFAASILTLYGTLPDFLRDKIAICMTKIREVMAKLLTTMSEELKEKKDQSVFLVNNCDLILALVREKGVNAEEIAFFTNLLSQASDAFVKTQLMSASYISQISSFVEEIAPLAQKGEVTHPKYNKEFVEELLRQFAKHWQAGIAGWSAEIPKLFTNFKMGTQLFQKIVEKMFSYLKREHV